MDEAGHLDPLEAALADPRWDDDFWLALEPAEAQARQALEDLYDIAYEGYGCACDTCMVRTILEAVWPAMTTQFKRLLAAKSEVRTLGAGAGDALPETTGCGGNCRCRNKG